MNGGEGMTVAELIEWLKTQDQGATVFVPVGERGYGWSGDSYSLVEFTPEHAEYTDLRGNPFVKPDAPHFDTRSLNLGVLA